jgi:hypothetical protein
LPGEIGLIIGPIHHNTKQADKKALSGQARAAPSRGIKRPEGNVSPTSSPAQTTDQRLYLTWTLAFKDPGMLITLHPLNQGLIFLIMAALVSLGQVARRPQQRFQDKSHLEWLPVEEVVRLARGG